MKPEQLAEIGSVAIRWFAPKKKLEADPSALQLGPQPKDEHEGMWRASRSGHYYTSDTGRLVNTSSDMSESIEGWGATPEEALDAPAAAIVRDAERNARGARNVADKMTEDAARIAARLAP